MSEGKHLLRGAVAGLAGGLLASWVMNEFMAGPGQKLQQALQRDEDNQQQQTKSNEPKEDATMKAADTVVGITTGGRHLSREQKERAGPVVHYTFGAVMGGLYGAAAEYWPDARAGFGTTFASALFAGADLIAVPVLQLGTSPEDEPVSALVSPFSAHLVYGFTTELVRRIVRSAM
jgi:putative membrane protein